MKKQGKQIVYIIGLIVLVTITIQFYWNYTQYNINKQQVVNEVQISLDNAVETYYTEISKNSILDLISNVPNLTDTISEPMSRISISSSDPIITKSIGNELISKGEIPQQIIDSLRHNINQSATISTISIVANGKEINDFDDSALKEHLSKVFISTKNDHINLLKIDSLFNDELHRKNINFNYNLIHKNKNDIILNQTSKLSDDFKLSSTSNSALLPTNTIIEVKYPDILWIVLKKGLTGIILSSVLSGIIIFILFYLLRVINKQKQLSEIKNDFISNITHELKTPIATVSTAVEAMQYFNTENNPQKNQKYLDISGQQLDKLKLLVDKIMETSLLESSELQLSKETVDLKELINNCVYKLKFSTEKNIIFNSNNDEIIWKVDKFHFENAVSNLIENAIKYGGDTIYVELNRTISNITILVSDNGKGVPKEHQKLIFDKFYRIPNQNQHNVKGFGIGLYYTKNIIEKHEGSIDLITEPGFTTFKIELWQK